MKSQIARDIYLNTLDVMKETLLLAEFKLGKETSDYKYFRKMTMNNFYNGLVRVFQHMEYDKMIVRCECMARLRNGYTACPNCGGSGYRNREALHPGAPRVPREVVKVETGQRSDDGTQSSGVGGREQPRGDADVNESGQQVPPQGDSSVREPV